jgi:AraC-like DNA-binding protein
MSASYIELLIDADNPDSSLHTIQNYFYGIMEKTPHFIQLKHTLKNEDNFHAFVNINKYFQVAANHSYYNTPIKLSIKGSEENPRFYFFFDIINKNLKSSSKENKSSVFQKIHQPLNYVRLLTGDLSGNFDCIDHKGVTIILDYNYLKSLVSAKVFDYLIEFTKLGRSNQHILHIQRNILEKAISLFDAMQKQTNQDLFLLKVLRLSHELVYSFIKEIVILHSGNSNSGFIKQKDEEVLTNIKEYLEEQLHKELPTVTDLSLRASMSETKFKTVFKIKFGITPIKYALLLKLEEAKKLLLKGKTQKEITELLCFSDVSHFNQSFRREFGITPKQYLRTQPK